MKVILYRLSIKTITAVLLLVKSCATRSERMNAPFTLKFARAFGPGRHQRYHTSTTAFQSGFYFSKNRDDQTIYRFTHDTTLKLRNVCELSYDSVPHDCRSYIFGRGKRRWDTMSNASFSFRLLSSTSSSTSNDKDTEKEELYYEELKKLTTIIQNHDMLYYTPGLIPTITDDEYDALTQREAELCINHPHLLKRLEVESGLGSKVSRYGGRVGPILQHGEEEDASQSTKAHKTMARMTGGKLIHLENAPMQSLDNAMMAPQVIKWLNRVRKGLFKSSSSFEGDLEANSISNGDDGDGITTHASTGTRDIEIIAEPKMDGLSLSLRYRLDDKKASKSSLLNVYQLEWGATRGDGKRGEDVTDAVNAIETIPQTFELPAQSSSSFPTPNIIEIRGEVVLPTSIFTELTSEVEVESATKNTNDTNTQVDKDGVDNNDNASENQNELVEQPKSQSGSLLPSQFSNARNAASGILMRRKSQSEMTQEEIENTKLLRSYLRFYAYSIGSSPIPYSSGEEGNGESSTNLYSSGLEMRSLLTDWGFAVPNPSEIVTLTIHKEEEVQESECQALFQFHDTIMSDRNGDINGANNSEKGFDFDVDGAVYKLTDVSDREVLGSSSRYPRWAIAHKFPAQCAVTRLQDIEVQIGRTGALTPVAVLEPVDLGGVTVSRASLHNFQFAQTILKAKKLNNSKSDDTGVMKGISVMISRAGDVIPQVLKRLENDSDHNEDATIDGDDVSNFISLQEPLACPACGSKAIFDIVAGRERKVTRTISSEPGNDEINTDGDEGSGSIGQVLRCGGPQLLCPPRAVGALAHAFSRTGLDVNGLSEARLQQLVNATLIKTPADLFKILDEDGEMIQNVTSLPGWGEKSARNLHSAVSKVATDGVTLSRFIYSLGIRHIGTHTSSLIASAYGSSSEFLAALDHAAEVDEKRLASISISEEAQEDSTIATPFLALSGTDTNEGVKGIGPVAIDSLVSFAQNEALVAAAKALGDKIPVHDLKKFSKNTSENDKADETSRPFHGKSVVFTGSLPDKMSRAEAQTYAMDVLGAKSTPSSVSKATGIVVIGEKGGKKAQKAEELGIQTMTAEEFLQLLNTLSDNN